MAGSRNTPGTTRGNSANAMRSKSVATMVERRFQRSTKTPATGPSAKTGIYCATSTPLMAVAEWVSENTHTSSVVLNRKSPMLEMACPTASNTKLRFFSSLSGNLATVSSGVGMVVSLDMASTPLCLFVVAFLHQYLSHGRRSKQLAYHIQTAYSTICQVGTDIVSEGANSDHFNIQAFAFRQCLFKVRAIVTDCADYPYIAH